MPVLSQNLRDFFINVKFIKLVYMVIYLLLWQTIRNDPLKRRMYFCLKAWRKLRREHPVEETAILLVARNEREKQKGPHTTVPAPSLRTLTPMTPESTTLKAKTTIKIEKSSVGNLCKTCVNWCWGNVSYSAWSSLGPSQAMSRRLRGLVSPLQSKALLSQDSCRKESVTQRNGTSCQDLSFHPRTNLLICRIKLDFSTDCQGCPP